MCCNKKKTKNKPDSAIATFLAMEEVNIAILKNITNFPTKIRVKRVVAKHCDVICPI
jgi:hypothetical protein